LTHATVLSIRSFAPDVHATVLELDPAQACLDLTLHRRGRPIALRARENAL
jgi:hypothetical protein